MFEFIFTNVTSCNKRYFMFKRVMDKLYYDTKLLKIIMRKRWCLFLIIFFILNYLLLSVSQNKYIRYYNVYGFIQFLYFENGTIVFGTPYSLKSIDSKFILRWHMSLDLNLRQENCVRPYTEQIIAWMNLDKKNKYHIRPLSKSTGSFTIPVCCDCTIIIYNL